MFFYGQDYGRTKVHNDCYKSKKYARLVICFSEDKNTRGIKYVGLVRGLNVYYSTLG